MKSIEVHERLNHALVIGASSGIRAATAVTLLRSLLYSSINPWNR
jgi:hypothetical protein